MWTANRVRRGAFLYQAAIAEWRLQAALLREDRKKTAERNNSTIIE